MKKKKPVKPVKKKTAIQEEVYESVYARRYQSLPIRMKPMSAFENRQFDRRATY